MLLAVDIGNSDTKFGIYDGESLVHKFRIPTQRGHAAFHFASHFDNLKYSITEALVCSVVPEINEAIVEQIHKELGVEAMLVTNDLDYGLEIRYEPLLAAGTDRLVNVFSAAERYGAPCIVCSFGTAFTIDVVNEHRVLLGGLIAPGMETMSKSLKLSTAKLPEVAIQKPASAIQNTTTGSIQSGIVYGYFGLATSLIARVKNEFSTKAKVIATGGFAMMISQNIDNIDIVDENLLLDGLMHLQKRFTRHR